MNRNAASLTGSRVLDEIAEVIGEEAAFALAWEFLGLRVFIPIEPDREPGIDAAIGPELGHRLRDRYHGTTISFPHRSVIERRVRQLANDGLPKREIARRLKIRQARVFAILARQRDDDQLSLF